MCTTEQTFAWVGALVVNIAFISIIAWGASTKWWVGFLISIVYTIILFVLARTVDKRSGWDIVPVATSANVNDNNSTVEVSSEESAARHDETQNNVVVAAVPIAADHPEQSTMLTRRSTATSERRMPVLANLLYGLFNIALGVTGYFLPLNLFSCYGFGPDYYSPTSGHWSTDISTLPSGVQTWASSIQSNHQMSVVTFAHISSSEGGQNSTLFQGSDGSGYYQTLWSTSNGGEPLNFPNIQNPAHFVSTGTDWACFTAINAMEQDSLLDSGYTNSLVGCSDGTTVATTADSAQYSFQSPYDLFIDSNKLWFKDPPLWSGYQSGTGTIIYSVDSYEDMTVELHSTYTQSKSEQNAEVYLSEVDANDDDKCWTKHSTLALFISALPITLSSILLWLKRKAPSSAITNYVGISAVMYCLYILTIDETNDYDEVFSFWKWWLPVSGSLYLAILCDLTHCKRNIARLPLIWGINFSALAFFVGMIILSGIFDTSVAWTWIVFNLVGLIPLLVVGIGYNQVFLLVLCAIGWLMTAFKIASAITNAASSAWNVPIYFVVFAISGLLIAGAGWWLNKNQDKLGSVIHDRMERLSLSRKLFSDVNVDVATITADEPINVETQGVESA